jgi:hypothetical protein
MSLQQFRIREILQQLKLRGVFTVAVNLRLSFC